MSSAGGPCRSTAVGWRDGRRSQWLVTQLAAGALVVSDQVIEAVSCYAVALVYDRQSTAVSDGAAFAAIARKFFARAENVASNITAELLTTDSPPRRIVIRLGTIDTLEG